jgi:dTDP-4-dehydrorhamnose 3,5-epimerase
MHFEETAVPGAWRIIPNRHTDSRGFFARTFCEREFAKRGIRSSFVQCNISFNTLRGTLRGMHFQMEPVAEAKLVRCTMGAAYDVILDLRKDSSAYGRWMACEITSENREALYVPPGCAHGFQTLADETELFYQMSEFYSPQAGAGVRWNDPAFAIRWPIPSPILSDRDQSYTDYIL